MNKIARIVVDGSFKETGDVLRFRNALIQIINHPAISQPRGQRPPELEALIAGTLHYMLGATGCNCYREDEADMAFSFTLADIAQFCKDYRPDLSYSVQGDIKLNTVCLAGQRSGSYIPESGDKDLFTLISEYALVSGQKEALVNGSGNRPLPLDCAIGGGVSEENCINHFKMLLDNDLGSHLSRTWHRGRTVWHNAVDKSYKWLSLELARHCGLNDAAMRQYIARNPFDEGDEKWRQGLKEGEEETTFPPKISSYAVLVRTSRNAPRQK